MDGWAAPPALDHITFSNEEQGRNMDFIWFCLIGLAAGYLAGVLAKGRGFGLIGNLIVGVLGAIVGGFLMGLLGLPASKFIGKLITAVLGALVLLFIVAQIKKR